MVLIDSLEALELVAENLTAMGNAGAIFAVDCKGKDLSRKGRISILQITSDGECFIVDVLHVGHRAVSAAFKALFESPGITKLMFDCRRDSDALFHQLGIRLCNVVDLQLKEVMGRDETLEAHAKSLACLGKNSGQYEHIYQLKGLKQCLASLGLMNKATRERTQLVDKQVCDDPNFWLHRPLSADAIFYAEQEVVVLFALDARLPSVSLHVLKMASEAYASLFSDEAFPEEVFVEHGFLPLHVVPFAPPEASGPLQKCGGCLRQLPGSTVSHYLEGHELQYCTLCYAISMMHRNRALSDQKRKSGIGNFRDQGISLPLLQRSEVLPIFA